MKIRALFIGAFCLLWFCTRPAEAHSGMSESESCSSGSKKIEELVRTDQRSKGLSLKIVPLPRLQDDLISLQVSAASSKTPEVIEIQFCEAVVSMYEVQNGKVVATTVLVDRDVPTWIVGLAPDGETFPLAGFTDSSSGFDKLMDTIRLQVINVDVASEVFDFYLKSADDSAHRGSIVVDEMQLQSSGLEDFRLRYSFTKARSEYARWWANIGPAIKGQLHRPSMMTEQNRFSVTYFRYLEGRVLREVAVISRNASVKVSDSKAICRLPGRAD